MKKIFCLTVLIVSFYAVCCYAADILPPEAIIGKGWAEVKKGNLTEAEKIFRFAESHLTGDHRAKALEGLAAVQFRLDQNKPKKTPKTVKKDPDLIFKQVEADGWEKFNDGDYKSALNLFQKARKARDIDVFNNSAYGEALAYIRIGNPKPAAEILFALFNSGFSRELTAKQLTPIVESNDFTKKNALKAYFSTKFAAEKDTGQKILYLQYYSVLAADSSALAMAEKISAPLSDEQSKIVNSIKIDIIHKNIKASQKDNLKTISEIDKLLAIAPNDAGMLLTRAWLCLDACKYDCAETSFNQLLKSSPDNEEYVYGLTMAYYDGNKDDDAIAASYGAKSDRITSLRDAVFNKKAADSYQNKDYEGTLKAIASISKPNDDNEELKAWSLYHLSRHDEAFKIFAELYKKAPSGKTAGDLIAITDNNVNSYKKTLSVLDDREKQPISDKLAELYGQKEQFCNASKYASGKSCYYNSDSTLIRAGYDFRNKTGSRGTSELRSSEAGLAAIVPLGRGWRAQASQKYIHLDSGKADTYPYAGKYYKYESTGVKVNDLSTKADLYSTSAEVIKEGVIFYSFGIGSTPYGGEIDPALTFKLSAWSENAKIKLYRKAVEDSILSISGLNDPYSGAEWGRVTDTGLSANYTLPFSSDYWVSLTGYADTYQGKNTAGNSSVAIDSAIGKTIEIGNTYNTFGLYASYFSYQNNQNHFTFGNGGYFSPQDATDYGLLYKIENNPCGQTWFSASVSGGYLSYHAASSRRYKKTSGDVSGAADFYADYPSENKSGFDGTLKFAILQRLSSHFALGSYIGMNISSRYNETIAGVALTYTPEKQKSLVNYKDMFGRKIYKEWEY